MRPLPLSCPRVELMTNSDRSPGRDPAVLTSRRTARTLFLGAGRPGLPPSGPGEGPAGVDPVELFGAARVLQPEEERRRRSRQAEVNSFRGNTVSEEKAIFRIPQCAY